MLLKDLIGSADIGTFNSYYLVPQTSELNVELCKLQQTSIYNDRIKNVPIRVDELIDSELLLNSKVQIVNIRNNKLVVELS